MVIDSSWVRACEPLPPASARIACMQQPREAATYPLPLVRSLLRSGWFSLQYLHLLQSMPPNPSALARRQARYLLRQDSTPHGGVRDASQLSRVVQEAHNPQRTHSGPSGLDPLCGEVEGRSGNSSESNAIVRVRWESRTAVFANTSVQVRVENLIFVITIFHRKGHP